MHTKSMYTIVINRHDELLCNLCKYRIVFSDVCRKKNNKPSFHLILYMHIMLWNVSICISHTFYLFTLALVNLSQSVADELDLGYWSCLAVYGCTCTSTVWKILIEIRGLPVGTLKDPVWLWDCPRFTYLCSCLKSMVWVQGNWTHL